MIEVIGREIRIDGRPRLVLAGEVHYFRLRREDWESRLDLLVEAGANAVASYIPWVVHELPDGTIDLTGSSRPELDLGAFVDLAARRGLWFVARPGPFVMAELKQEGIPARVAREHPEVVPVGWDGDPPPTSDLEYLAPAFLDETRRWYDAVGAVLSPRMHAAGGPVIAVQLDNEVGMLRWISNCPNLADDVVAGWRAWLDQHYGPALAGRYPEWFLKSSPTDLAAVVRTPTEEVACALGVDLGRYMRQRFARYVVALRDMAERAGMGGVPFLVNVHGTAGGRGLSFPIGLSQLVETFAGIPGMVAGSDHYLGDLTLSSAGDLHMINAFMAALNGPDQPVTALEFEAGTGDYGSDLGHATDPSAVVLKTRLSLAQETRMINVYLFAGGTNFVSDVPSTDGTRRFGITGERHGHAAPVGPEGQRSPMFAATASALRVARTHERWLAAAREEHDGVGLGLVLDHYLTEYAYPGSPIMRDTVDELEWARGAGPRALLTRLLGYGGFRFTAVDLEQPLGTEWATRTVVLSSPTRCDPDVQQRLADHVVGGGGLFLLGAVPTRTLDGRECLLLADALGVKPVGEVREQAHLFPSITAHGWAADRTEVRVGRLQVLDPGDGEVLLRDAMTGSPCAVDVAAGAGRAIVLATEYVADFVMFNRAMQRLGVTRGLTHDSDLPGLLATTTLTGEDDRFLHVINVSGYEHRPTFTLDGVELLGGVRLRLPPRSGLLLPLGVAIEGNRLESTAEIVDVDDGSVTLALQGDGERVLLDGVDQEVPPRAGPHVLQLR